MTQFSVSNTDSSVGWTVHGSGSTLSDTLALYYGDPFATSYGGGASAGTVTTVAHRAAAGRRAVARLPHAARRGARRAARHAGHRHARRQHLHPAVCARTPRRRWATGSTCPSISAALAARRSSSRGTSTRSTTRGNDGEGVYIDDLFLTSTCAQRRCLIDSGCDDGFAATVSYCGALGTCQFEPLGDFCETDDQCDDGNPCTRGGWHGAGLCVLAHPRLLHIRRRLR